MLQIYILFIFMNSAYGHYTVHTQEFFTLKQCEYAKSLIVNSAYTSYCIKK